MLVRAAWTCVLFVMSACASSPPLLTEANASPSTVMFAAQQDASAVRTAIARALTERGYRVESEQDAHIVAVYSRHHALLRVAVDYAPDRAVLSYVDSTNVEKQQYHGWMRNLERSIREAVAHPKVAPPEPAAPRSPAPMIVLVEPARELGPVRGAVSRALVGRRYVIESEEAQRIIARYTHGDAFLRIAVDYEPSRALISFVESENVELERYEGWMRNLQSSLQQELARSDAPQPATPRGPEPLTVLIEPHGELGAVRGAVSRALVGRHYVVESENERSIVARYTHGAAFLRIVVDYEPERAVISFVESQNVELARYEGWMRNLQSTLQRELQRPGSQRAAATGT